MSMTVIEHIELGSASASITFSSIPATYTDLYLIYSLRSAQAGYSFDDNLIRINSDSGSNYSGRFLRTRDGAVASDTTPATGITFYGVPAGNATANTFGSGSLYIPNYQSSVAKSISTDGYSENNSASAVQGGITATLYNQTSAITTLTILSINGWNLAQYSSATLFGITAGSSGGVTVS